MKTIGIIGGMSWESTVTYYQIINTLVKDRLGGFHSAKCLLYSVDFHEVEACMAQGDWDGAAAIVADAAIALENGGADFFLIATNTVHKVAGQVRDAVNIPLLHIADAVADDLAKYGVQTVGFLGTKYTMEQDFYRNKLAAHGFDMIIPGVEDRDRLNEIIFGELCLGSVRQESRMFLLDCIESLERVGAEAVVLGCTELGMLAEQDDVELPLFDTTLIHARRAALHALGER